MLPFSPLNSPSAKSFKGEEEEEEESMGEVAGGGRSRGLSQGGADEVPQ